MLSTLLFVTVGPIFFKKKKKYGKSYGKLYCCVTAVPVSLDSEHRFRIIG